MDMIPRLRLFGLITTVSLALTACGGGGSGSSPNTEPNPTPNPTPNPNPTPGPTPTSFGLLKPAESDNELAAALRTGMARNNVAGAPSSSVDFSPAPEGSDGLAAEFSTTNLQEAGVDEADRVKYDGEVLYVANVLTEPGEVPINDFGISFAPNQVQSTVSLYRTDANAATTELAATITFEEDESRQKLFLRVTDESKQLLSISETFNYISWGLFADFSYWQDQSTNVRGFDVNNPDNPSEQFSLEIEGGLLTSRRIDDTLYVITRFSPTVEGLQPYPVTDADRENNEALLEQVTAADLLPEFSRNGGPPEGLVSGGDCYVPNEEYEGPEAMVSSSSIITVTAIDLNAPDNMSSICMNGFSNGFYVSLHNLYITTNAANDKTLIHKVALNDGQPEYRGSGEVPGYIGTSSPSFLMSESGDDLRVVSSDWSNEPFPLPIMPVPEQAFDSSESEQEEDLGRHFLTILRENSNSARLEQVAQLPNSSRPAHIGKPGEDLFAARFIGDKAYLVTFQTIDPLYVIDLADPTEPRIEGELEIPGFSTLLQPLDNGLLLGIGSDVDEALVQGVKISLFDVSDSANPIELDTEIVGKRASYSPALYEHHAVTLLKSGDNYRLALPIRRHARLQDGADPSDPWAYYEWNDSSLYEYVIDATAGSITAVGKISAEEYSGEITYPAIDLSGSRSVIHEDAVFFSVPGLEEVLSAIWGQE